MQIGILARIIEIVEKQIPTVAGDERLHGMTLIADDLDRFRAGEIARRAGGGRGRECA
jgi:hypothetical protein